MPQKRNLLKLTVLLVSSLTIMSIITISPALPEMANAFAGVPRAEFLVKLLLTVPAFFIALSSFFVGGLIDRYGRLTLLWIALILYAVAGTAGFYLDNLYYLLASRGLLGVAVGISMTIVITLIADYFEGRERQRFVGIQVAFMSLGGILFVGLGGALADISWRYPFLIYLFSLAVLPLTFLYLHEPEVTRRADPSDIPALKSPPVIWLLFFNVMFMWILFFLIPVQIPFLLKEVGVSSNAKVGIAISLSTAFSAISSFSYSRIKDRFGFRSIFAAGYLLMAAAFALVAYGQAYWTTILAMMLAGFGIGMMIPNTNMWVMKIAPPEIRGREMGRLTTFWFMGQFLSPLILLPVSDVISVANTFYLAGATLLALSLFFAGWQLRSRPAGLDPALETEKAE